MKFFGEGLMRGQREKDDDKTAEVLDPEAASGKGRCEDRKKVGVGGKGRDPVTKLRFRSACCTSYGLSWSQ